MSGIFGFFKRYIKTLFFIITAFFLVSGVYCVSEYREYHRDVESLAKKQLLDLTRGAVRKIDDSLQQTMTVTHDLAGRITRMGGPVPKLESEIKKLIKEHELFNGICIAYKPYAYSKRIKLYAPYWVRKTDKIECIRVEDMYDYTGLVLFSAIIVNAT